MWGSRCIHHVPTTLSTLSSSPTPARALGRRREFELRNYMLDCSFVGERNVEMVTKLLQHLNNPPSLFAHSCLNSPLSPSSCPTDSFSRSCTSRSHHAPQEPPGMLLQELLISRYVDCAVFASPGQRALTRSLPLGMAVGPFSPLHRPHVGAP